MYEITIDFDGLKDALKYYKNLDKKLNSKEFMQFITQKALSELNVIMNRKLVNITENDMPLAKVEEYQRNNKAIVNTNSAEIYNDTYISPDEMYWVSNKTKERYPEGISVAYIIEYGTGLNGESQPDWEVNLPSPSKNYDGTWSFARDGEKHLKVSGTVPQFIYLELKNRVEQKYADWVLEYIESEM